MVVVVTAVIAVVIVVVTATVVSEGKSIFFPLYFACKVGWVFHLQIGATLSQQ
jgi:hypothetical protein